MKITEELLDRGQEIQEDMHAFTESFIKKNAEIGGKPGIYQDWVNVFLMNKLAELELEIEGLKQLKR